MKKNIMRLSESQLKRVIKESVKRVLRENDVSNNPFYAMLNEFIEQRVLKRINNGEEFEMFIDALKELASYFEYEYYDYDR